MFGRRCGERAEDTSCDLGWSVKALVEMGTFEPSLEKLNIGLEASRKLCK